MSSCKKFFFAFYVFFLFVSYSHAAYQNPYKIDDYEFLKKAETMGQILIDKQNDFWTELKYFFKWEKFCHHKIKGYLSLIEFFFDRIQNKALNKEGMAYGWKDLDAVDKVFEKHFPQDQSFYAFIILRDMILSSALFKNLENPNFKFQNGFRHFWEPVQDLFRKDPSINRLWFFEETMVLTKNVENLLLINQEGYFKDTGKDILKLSKDDRAAYKKQENEWFKNHMRNRSCESGVAGKLIDLWPKVLDDIFLTSIFYNLIENFCLSSDFFKYLEN